jgi:hypothetical protein
MFPWTTVGTPVPALLQLRPASKGWTICLKPQPTKPAQMILCTAWISSVPLKSWSCPLRGLWRTLEWLSCVNHPQPTVSTWLLPKIWRAVSHSCHCLWLVTRPPTIPHMYRKRKDSASRLKTHILIYCCQNFRWSSSNDLSHSTSTIALSCSWWH